MEPLFFKAENRISWLFDCRIPVRFNGAAFFQSGKLLRQSCYCRSANSFNGAAFFQSGKYPCGFREFGVLGLLQWSRFFSKRKMFTHAQAIAVADVASMEPLFFKAENPSHRLRNRARPACFNGAAFFQSGKYFYAEPASQTFGSFNGAAFFQSGKSRGPATWSAGSNWLQWSRFFSKRKMSTWRKIISAKRGLQWSRFFSKRKICALQLVQVAEGTLQWSRFFSKRKIILRCCWPLLSWVLQLQWSRFFSKRKMVRNLFAGPWPKLCFNGAAFFQSGKSRRAVRGRNRR